LQAASAPLALIKAAVKSAAATTVIFLVIVFPHFLAGRTILSACEADRMSKRFGLMCENRTASYRWITELVTMGVLVGER
jgi:hypothetical protein